MWASDSIIGVLQRAVAMRPNDILLSSPDGQALTYAQFMKKACLVAEALHKAGHKKGGHVTIQSENAMVFFPFLFGVWLNAGVAVPLNLRYSSAILSSIIERVDPHFMLLDGEPLVARPQAFSLQFADLPENAPDPAAGRLMEPDADAVAMLYFTSGTTGVSKGAELSWNAVNLNAFEVGKLLELRESDKLYINTPPYYTSGVCHFLTVLSKMGSMVCSSGFHFGADMLEEMESCECTAFGGAPAHVIRAVQPLTGPVRPGRLRLWITSGDHLAREMLDRARTVFPAVSFYVIYGLSEVAGRLCIQKPGDHDAHPGSVGRPIAKMLVSVRDEEGRELPPGESGEIYVSGPGLMKGYFKEPVLTEASIGKYGFRTGDIGKKDAAGYLWVEGRRDDIFKSGGEKVSLQLVQRALFELPGVCDAAAAAEEDQILGKTVCAFLVLREKESLTRLEVLKALRGKIPDNHLPKRVLFLQAIPRTGSGKAIRAALAAIMRDAEQKL